MWHALWHALKRMAANERGSMRFAGRNIRETYREFNGTGGAGPSLPLNSIQIHNPLNLFDGNADFRYIQGTGLLIGINTPIYLDANGGSSQNYVKYNSTTDYIELYTDGALRAQF